MLAEAPRYPLSGYLQGIRENYRHRQDERSPRIWLTPEKKAAIDLQKKGKEALERIREMNLSKIEFTEEHIKKLSEKLEQEQNNKMENIFLGKTESSECATRNAALSVIGIIQKVFIEKNIEYVNYPVSFFEYMAAMVYDNPTRAKEWTPFQKTQNKKLSTYNSIDETARNMCRKCIVMALETFANSK